MEKNEYVSFDDFVKSDFRIGKIINVEELTEKLFKIIVLADKERTIISGIRKYYTKEELVGKSVVLIINLEPRKIMGIMSEGMILAAEKGKKVVLLTTDKDIDENAKVH